MFNANGDRVAFYENSGGKNKINQGNVGEIQAEFLDDGNYQKPEYIVVSASGTDAICITAITVTHPMSQDTYSFLPGEMAVACDIWDKNIDYPHEESNAQIQFQDSKSGQKQEARPHCMWIDGGSKEGDSGDTTEWKGFQVHLPDFKPDGSTPKAWKDDPYQMCGSRTRFGVYKTLNKYSG